MAPVKLTAEKVRNLQAAQRQLHDLLPDIDKAEQCGIDCQEFRGLVDEAQKTIEKLITNFGKQ